MPKYFFVIYYAYSSLLFVVVVVILVLLLPPFAPTSFSFLTLVGSAVCVFRLCVAKKETCVVAV